jgi:hypothetical protein
MVESPLQTNLRRRDYVNIISVEVFYRFIDFGHNFEVHDNLDFKGLYESEEYTHEMESDLYRTIMMKKGDGVSMDIDSTGNLHTIKIFLIFSTDGEADWSLIGLIRGWIDSHFRNKQNEDYSFAGVEITKEGLIVELQDVVFRELAPNLINELNENGMKCDIVGHKKRSYDNGSGDYREAILFFVASSIAGGVTWDIIKPLFLKVYRKFTDEIGSMERHKSFNSARLIDSISELTGENQLNSIITDVNTNVETGLTRVILQTRNSRIYVTCDDNENITNYRVEEITQTRI